MKIWIVLGKTECEGSEILKCFSKQKNAVIYARECRDKKFNTYAEEHRVPFQRHDVIEFEVD